MQTTSSLPTPYLNQRITLMRGSPYEMTFFYGDTRTRNNKQSPKLLVHVIMWTTHRKRPCRWFLTLEGKLAFLLVVAKIQNVCLGYWYKYIFLCCNGTNLCLHNNLVLSCSQAPFWLAPTELDQATRTSTKNQQMMKKTTLERKTIASRSADQQAKKALASQKICRIRSQRSPSPTTTTSAEDTQCSRTPVPTLPLLPQSLLQVRHAFHINRISWRFQA